MTEIAATRTTRQTKRPSQTPAWVKTKLAVVSLLVVAAVGVVGFRVVELASPPPADAAITLAHAVEQDWSAHSDVASTHTVCSRDYAAFTWLCGWDIPTGHVRMRVIYTGDGSFSFAGGLPFIPRNNRI